MNDGIPMLSIIKRGTKKFPRYVVAKSDEFRNPVYWTGTEWVSDEANARVYANANEALWAYHDLLIENVADRPSHLYLAPVYIEIFGDKPKLADLRAWLQKAVRMVVDSPKCGHGPSDTVGVIIADFEKTRSV